jgi:MinD-like ATPase involved in chromosome partitioning or flagellar assembly
MTDRRVGIVYGSRDWRKALQLHVRNHVRGTRILVVRDERMAIEEPLDVLIVDDETSFLTGDLVELLRAKGVRLIGVHDPSDGGTGLARLNNVGIDVTLDAGSTPEEIVVAIERLGDRLDDDFARLTAQFDGLGSVSETGLTVVVGGPPTVGKTEVAVGMAGLLASHSQALLVDAADTYPSIARRLHLALHPHLLSAFDEVRTAPLATTAGGVPLAASLARPAAGSDHPDLPFDVVCGLANPTDWQVVRGEDLSALLRRAAGPWRYVICDSGPNLEDLVTLDRWPLSRTATAHADRVIAVCGPTPDGMLRFLDWLVDLATLSPVAVDVVVNRAPRAQSQRVEFEDQLHENAGRRIASVTFVPEDDRVARAAWDGHELRRSSFLKALRPLAASLQASPTAALVA